MSVNYCGHCKETSESFFDDTCQEMLCGRCHSSDLGPAAGMGEAMDNIRVTAGLMDALLNDFFSEQEDCVDFNKLNLFVQKSLSDAIRKRRESL